MSNQSTVEYLASHKFFSGLNDDILQFLCEHSSEFSIKKRQILFRQGENADKFYIVRSGLVAIQVPAIMSLNLEIQTLGKDQVLGWSWLISPYKWNFQAMPEADSELLMFDGAMILAQCEQEPRFGYELLKKFAALMSIRLDVARQEMMEEWNPAGFA